MIMAGGSGTRLWPMSRASHPKQLIEFIEGRSLLQIAWSRLEGLVEPQQRLICAGETHRDSILSALPQVQSSQFFGEPVGRDTLNAVGFVAAVLAHQDPEAVIAVFTADHIIEPVNRFQEIVARGFELAEADRNHLVTFGIRPTHAATGFGYLELGKRIAEDALVVQRFKEKPDAETAQGYFDAGSDRYLWNSGMFVWRAQTLVDCLRRFAPRNAQGLSQIAERWGTARQNEVLEQVYPTLPKTSVDYAVMEPASQDASLEVLAVPMPLSWLDVGSWPAFASTCRKDGNGNALAAGHHVLLDSRNTLVASDDPEHLVATIGVEDLVIVHTADATLVCRAGRAESIKELHDTIRQQFEGRWL